MNIGSRITGPFVVPLHLSDINRQGCVDDWPRSECILEPGAFPPWGCGVDKVPFIRQAKRRSPHGHFILPVADLLLGRNCLSAKDLDPFFHQKEPVVEGTVAETAGNLVINRPRDCGVGSVERERVNHFIAKPDPVAPVGSWMRVGNGRSLSLARSEPAKVANAVLDGRVSRAMPCQGQ